MHRHYNGLNIIIFCLLLIISYTTKSSETEDSLVLINSGNSCGMGFLCEIGNDIYLLTNVHAIECPGKYSFILMSGEELEILEMEVADKLDMARLRIDDTYIDVTALNISSNNPSINDPIVVYGNSKGSMTVGKLKGKVTKIGPDVIEISANIIQGNSGSPIVDKNGKIVGMATYAEKKKPIFGSENAGNSEIRKYGIKINNDIKWNKAALTTFTCQASLLNDIENYLWDIAHVMPKMMTNIETCKKTNVEPVKKSNNKINAVEQKSMVNKIIECPASEALYTDKSWFKLIKNVCDAHNKFVQTICEQPKGGMYDPKSLKIAEGNKFKSALNDIYNAPAKKLIGNEWISNYYRDKCKAMQEHVSSLSNAVYKIKNYYNLDGLAYEKLKL